MKLIHLGDLHLGKSLGEYDLAEDQIYFKTDSATHKEGVGGCRTDCGRCV